MLTTSTITTLDLFLKECCVCAPVYSVDKGSLYSAYASFCIAKGETPLHINCVCKVLKVRPGISEGRTKTARIWVGVKVLEIQSVKQVTEAELTQALPSLLKTEEGEPSVEKPKMIWPSSPKPKPTLLHEPTINSVDFLLLKIMLGELGTQGF